MYVGLGSLIGFLFFLEGFAFQNLGFWGSISLQNLDDFDFRAGFISKNDDVGIFILRVHSVSICVFFSHHLLLFGLGDQFFRSDNTEFRILWVVDEPDGADLFHSILVCKDEVELVGLAEF